MSDPSGIRMDYTPSVVLATEGEAGEEPPATQIEEVSSKEDVPSSSSPTSPVAPGSVATSSSMPSKASSQEALAGTAAHSIGPNFKDQVRPYSVGKDRDDKSARVGAIASHEKGPNFKDQAGYAEGDEQAGGSASAFSTKNRRDKSARGGTNISSESGPNFKDQAGYAEGEERVVGGVSTSPSKHPNNNDLPESEMPSRHEVERDEEDGMVGENRTNLISAQLVTENPRESEDIMEAEILRGGIFLNRRTWIVLAVLMLVTGATVGGVCGGTDLCSTGSTVVLDSPTQAPTDVPTVAPTVAPTIAPTLSDDSQQIVEFIERIRFSTDPINFDNLKTNNATAVERGLDWLLHGDPMQLTLDGDGDAETVRHLTQRFALATFFYSTDGLAWSIRSRKWLSGEDECSWFGVVCVVSETNDGVVQRNGVVSALGSNIPQLDARLDMVGLNGTLASDLSLLSALTQIYLPCPSKGLRGTLPDSFMNISSLQWLAVNGCSLTGSLPASLGTWTDLVIFDVRDNFFTGSLPSEIGMWTGLNQFAVASNDFSQSLPTSISSWSQIGVFFIDSNSFTGQIPDVISSWSRITTFSAADNSISGPIPSAMVQWSSLETLVLANNSMTGSLPVEVGSWTNLATFDIALNQFTSTLPSTIGNWTNLRQFQLSYPTDSLEKHNLFNGTLPSSIGSWTSLQFFGVSNNLFTGMLPESMGNWSNLQLFIANGNFFAGSLPSSIGNWQALTAFYVFDNFLTGPLPAEIGNWNFIEFFFIGGRLLPNGNSFNGPLPDSVGSWRNLERIAAHNCSLTGTLPESMQQWTSIKHLTMSMNPDLGGTLPAVLDQAWRLNMVETFRVHSTGLTGTIPYESWGFIKQASFHDTHLTGTMPSAFCLGESVENVTADCAELQCNCCFCF